MRFDSAKLLLDPYGRGVAMPDCYRRSDAATDADNCATAMKSVVVDPSTYDWEGDAPLRHPSARTIVYEMHVRGFTRHPSSGVDATKRGTFAGLSRRFRISSSSASQRWNCFQYSSSIRRRVPLGK
jgi:glycogen operon protein